MQNLEPLTPSTCGHRCLCSGLAAGRLCVCQHSLEASLWHLRVQVFKTKYTSPCLLIMGRAKQPSFTSKGMGRSGVKTPKPGGKPRHCYTFYRLITASLLSELECYRSQNHVILGWRALAPQLATSVHQCTCALTSFATVR